MSIMVGKGVGRRFPGVGARVLLVPALDLVARRRRMIDFMFDLSEVFCMSNAICEKRIDCSLIGDSV